MDSVVCCFYNVYWSNLRIRLLVIRNGVVFGEYVCGVCFLMGIVVVCLNNVV